MNLQRMLVYCVLLCACAGCSDFQILDALVPRWDYTARTNVAYGALPRQKLDVCLPKNPKPNAGIIIFFYGGGWQYGERGDYRFVGEALASRGYIAILPDYRIYPPYTFPSFIQDGALAVRWARDHAKKLGGDPGHIYLMGHSAGAHIAVMLTLDNEYLKAVGMDRSDIRATAGLSGPYDFVIGPGVRPVFGLMPDDPSAKPNVEPINFVDGFAPPILLQHGLEDDIVESGNSSRLFSKICRAGGPVELATYPNLGHRGVALALAKPFWWLAPVLDDTLRFFEKYR
jgi:acetyl esterase/lipase